MAGDVRKLGKDKNNPFDKPTFSVPVFARVHESELDEFPSKKESTDPVEQAAMNLYRALKYPAYEVDIAWNYTEDEDD